MQCSNKPTSDKKYLSDRMNISNDFKNLKQQKSNGIKHCRISSSTNLSKELSKLLPTSH